MLNIHALEVNPIQENCYIVSDESKECVIIDCGALYENEKEAVKKYIESNELKPIHLLNTHLHFDHVWRNDFIYSTYGLMTEPSDRDKDIYNDVPGQIEQIIGHQWKYPFFAPMGKALIEDDIVKFGTHQLKVIATPGHTPGGICFYCQEENVLFSGDSLFYCSIGRTDLPGGNQRDLIENLKNKILSLPDNTIVYPGHGPATKIEIEKHYNPYLS
jgi:glyoxylase-like metal-dependent hydrolase (beta-lactamase superfamily II)